LGCSVKTIRRRIKAGTWRSMIEYQGQKAIRLVAREDILKETSIQKPPSFSAMDSNFAVHALENVHHQLDRTIGTNLEDLNRKFSSAVFGSRVYLVVALIITAICLVAFMVIFSDSREEVIGQRMLDIKDELSTIIADNQRASSETANQTSRQYERSLAITTDSNKEIKTARGEIKKLSTTLDSTKKQSADSMREVENTRAEVTALRRELAQLRAEINSLRELPPEVTAPAGEEAITPVEEREEEEEKEGGGEGTQIPTPIPSPPPPEEKEEESSGFLGIF